MEQLSKILLFVGPLVLPAQALVSVTIHVKEPLANILKPLVGWTSGTILGKNML